MDIKERKLRGRVKGQTKTLSCIKDPALGIYYIEINNDGYNVFEEGKLPVIAYCATLSGALNKISKNLTNTGKTMSLREYVNEYKQILNQLKKLFNE